MIQPQRPRTCLYLITPPDARFPEFTPQVREAFLGGDVGALQIRLKDENYKILPEEIQAAAIAALKPLCAEFGVALIMNDSPELAKKYDLDGVHIGLEDGSVEAARAIVGEEKTIGVSCYASKDRAFTAGETGADYVAFGQFFPTKTKPPKGFADLDLLTFWQEATEIPCVAIGGLKVDNCRPMIEAGADFIAVVTGVWDYPAGPRQAVADFNAVIDAVFTPK